MWVRLQPIQWMPVYLIKQDVPAWLALAMECQNRKVVLRKDRTVDCKTNMQTTRQWFLKKRPMQPRSWTTWTGAFFVHKNCPSRLSFLKPWHLFSSHTKTLRPTVSETGKRGPACLGELLVNSKWGGNLRFGLSQGISDAGQKAWLMGSSATQM